MKIGILGISLSSNNYGVTALGYTQLSMLEEILNNSYIKDVEFFIFSPDSQEIIDENVKLIRVIHKTKVKKNMNIKSGLSGIIRMAKNIDECDFVIDLTYGDSFSDIYGKKIFYLYSIPKMIANKKKKLILGPQTIGPFKNKLIEKIAKTILIKAEIICVRDEKSLDYTRQLTNRNDIVLSSDLAMKLPFEKQTISNGKFNVGINISELLYYNDNNKNEKDFQIVVDYKKFIDSIINRFYSEKYQIHIVTHVFSKDDNQGEYGLAKKIHHDYPKTILAPKFKNPIDAKSYLSGLDLFFGSRMHATIGAFSAGIPVIPMSYSRKFEGLYESLNYNYGINLRDTTIENGLEHIDYCLDNYLKMKEDLNRSLEKALQRNDDYKRILESMIVGEKNDNKQDM